MSVYKAINAVQAALTKDGIGKDRKNQQQGFNFRGIDDVYNALSPLLARYGLCILPRMVSRECVERISAKGGALFYVTVGAEFDFVCADDGSKHTVVTYGEAMDSGDKATNKAMSAAYKYACMQAFSIPTEGDNDADAHTHEVAPRQYMGPTAEPKDHIAAARLVELEECALTMIDAHRGGNDLAAFELYYGLKDNEEKVHVWGLLKAESKLRAAIKANPQKVSHSQMHVDITGTTA